MAGDALQYFRIEAREHIERLNADLLELERTPGDAELVNRLFRVAHTLKGAARMVSQNDIGAIAHKVEDVLGALRDDGLEATEELVSGLLQAVEVIVGLVTVLEDGEAEDTDPGPVLERLQEAMRRAGEPQPAAEAKTGRSKSKPDGRAKGKPAGKTPPKTAATDQYEDPDSPAVGKDGEVASVADPSVAVSAVSTDTGYLRVAVDKVDVLANLAGELLMHRMRLGDESVRMRNLIGEALRVVRTMQEVRQWAETGEVHDLLSGTPAGEVLYPLMARVRTTSLKEGLKGVVADTRRQIAQMDQVATGLHQGIMDLRMLPAATVTIPLKLVVRETAIALGRQARLEVSGEDIEMDKALLDNLKEPLAHLLRNAVDHGIEPPAEREAAGKPPEGAVRLSFARNGAQLVVTVSDDGRGVDLDKVRDLAIRRGLIERRSLQLNDPVELARCLTLPGFSTAATVTEVSGRGVGLDVVARSIQELNGHLQVAPGPGSGVRITLRVPVDLSTMDGFLFTSEGRTLAVAMEHVSNVRYIQPKDISVCAGQRVLRMDGGAVPLVTLGALLGGNPAEAVHTAVLFEYGGERIAVGVDRVTGVRTVVIKPLPPHVGELPWVSGITVLPSGLPVVILNLPHLMARAGASGPGDGSRAVEPAQTVVRPRPGGRSQPTALVVDDSLSARMMVKRMLESAGFRAVLAEDGREALERLAGGGIDVLVTDVEMPRMDGFALVRRLREQQATRTLPVVIVSSLQAEKEHKQGRAAGADAFLVKSDLNRKLLEDTIRKVMEKTDAEA